MTLPEARLLRDRIRADGYRCTVPLGKQQYFVRVQVRRCTLDVVSVEQWEAEKRRMEEGG